MGSLFSRPSTPSYTSFVYQPNASPTPQASIPSAPSSPSQSDSQDEVITGAGVPAAEEEEVRDLVRRAARGRVSTVLTSYRGVLSDNGSLAPQRKTLLGE